MAEINSWNKCETVERDKKCELRHFFTQFKASVFENWASKAGFYYRNKRSNSGPENFEITKWVGLTGLLYQHLIISCSLHFSPQRFEILNVGRHETDQGEKPRKGFTDHYQKSTGL